MGLTIYSSDCSGVAANCYYKRKNLVSDEETLKRAVCRDYVCAEYRNAYRNNKNFIKSNCLALDVDNDKSDNPEDWILPKDIIEHFDGVTIGFHFSRHNMTDKPYVDRVTGEVVRSVTARPRYHVFFEIDTEYDYEQYKRMKEKTISEFPCFDRNAADAARFFFGTDNADVIYHQGTKTLNEWFDEENFDESLSTIKVGTRNSTLSHFAGRVLKRYGNTEQAYCCFIEKNEQCEPPLDNEELNTIWKSALKFYSRVSGNPDYIPPEQYEKITDIPVSEVKWDIPIPFESGDLPPFPIEVLPPVIRNYASAVAVSTQTPVDMAATAGLAVVSACMRNLYKVEGKSDWLEPTNIYAAIVAEPSERKSAVNSLAAKPVDEYIKEFNEKHKVEFEMSKATKQRLENKKNSLLNTSRKRGEDSSAADFNEELQNVIEQLVNFKEVKPLKIYVDDTTPEKLTETMSENGNAISIISSEGGIFDVLSGAYSSKVNIDVFLKAYSGEHISVERIMRNSISVDDACLTILLSVQPVVISELMSNKKFRHRGLTARFLYSMPKSFVGSRKLESQTIPEESYIAYKKLIYNILSEKRGKHPEIIRLDEEARKELIKYYDWVEKMLAGEFSMYSDWLGKLVGNTLRIAGIFARCGVLKKDVGEDILETDEPIIIGKKTIENAIALGKYFFVHAVAAYGNMGIRSDFKAALNTVQKIKEKGLKEVTRRDIMRFCRWVGSADEAQSILNNLEDYGYVRISSVDVTDKMRFGRPKNAVYAVNPCVFK